MLVLCAVMLASCVKPSLVPETPSVSEEQNVEHKIVLEFWHTYSDLETTVFETKVLPLFEEQFPHIKVDAIRKDYTEQLKDTILAAAADRRQPDLMRLDIVWVPELAKSGVLEPLSNFASFETLRDQFIGALLQTNLYQGEYYGLPVNANTKAAIFNMKLLKEAGLNHPPQTFTQLIDAQQRLTPQYPGLYSIGICCSGAWGTLPYFWTLGGQLMNEDYTIASGFLDSPESIAALTKLKHWYDEGIMSPSIITGEPGTWDGILKGELLMIDEAHWFYSVNDGGENHDLLQDTAVSLFPNSTRVGTSIIGGENLVLFTNSPHKQEAWEFLSWMMTEEPQSIMAETGLIPTNKRLQHANQNQLFAPYFEQLHAASPRPPVSTWTKIDDEYAKMIERILTDEMPLEQAVRQAAERIDLLLQQQ